MGTRSSNEGYPICGKHDVQPVASPKPFVNQGTLIVGFGHLMRLSGNVISYFEDGTGTL